MHAAMGTLVDPPSILGSKARWFDITDDLPQYEEHVTP
jgi:hypothetical protein